MNPKTGKPTALNNTVAEKDHEARRCGTGRGDHCRMKDRIKDTFTNWTDDKPPDDRGRMRASRKWGWSAIKN